MRARLTLTVVILSYNSEKTINQCLSSLLNQKYKDFEILVIDDGSTDDTLAIVSRYKSILRISVVQNGSHSISRGRNIGLAESRSDIVAFLDSDDEATADWTAVIVDAFEGKPGMVCLSGDLIPGFRTRIAQAIALNDGAVREKFQSDAAFIAGNCAIYRSAALDVRFNEDFRYAEDLELVARVKARGQWLHVPEMRIRYYSRDTLRQYAVQMYRYGFAKMHYAYDSKSYRWLDFVPLSLMLGGFFASLLGLSWWLPFLILPFSLLESFFVVFTYRCPAGVAVMTFPAWVVKNVFWSCGIGWALIRLALGPYSRRLLTSKRMTGG